MTTRKKKHVMSETKTSKPNSSESNQTFPESDTISDKVMRSEILQSILLQLLEIGVIVEEDIEDGSYGKKVKEFFSNSDIPVVIDHTEDVLNIARAQINNKDWNEALLHYAIFVEHKINGIIVRLGQKTEVPAAAIKGLLRELRLPSKATWVLELLGGQAFDKETVNKMDYIAEVRNAYVHYKWNEKNDLTKLKIEEAINVAEELVVKINCYEDEILFDHKRQDLINLISSKFD